MFSARVTEGCGAAPSRHNRVDYVVTGQSCPRAGQVNGKVRLQRNVIPPGVFRLSVDERHPATSRNELVPSRTARQPCLNFLLKNPGRK
jgi:hypothetical protein